MAALCGLLLLVPIGASVGRALADGWIPSNDDALIVLQARDVLTTDPPLIGQPSTSELYADGLTARHPGRHRVLPAGRCRSGCSDRRWARS